MQVKKYVASNMRLALKQVSEEEGPDAIILSNRRVPEGVELTIACEELAGGYAEPSVQESAAPAEPEPPSKLELELERMQVQARERAQSLAGTLSRSEQRSFAQAMAEQQPAPRVDQEAVQPASAPVQQAVRATEDTEALLERQKRLFDSILASNEQQMAQMREELSVMKDVLADQLSTLAWGQFESNNPERASLLRRLTRMGVEQGLANRLLDHTQLAGSERQNWVGLMKAFKESVPVVAGDLVSQEGIFAFVGPTGAGKSTTIAKLATRHVMEHGSDDIALVTTDTVRIAGHEQLRTLGRILNVPVHVVDQDNNLERVLYGLRHKRLVLVDTAGCGPNDGRLADQLNALNALAGRLKTVLVLPASSQTGVLKAAYHSYQTDSLQACVFTKLDEADSLGGVLSVAAEKQLPVAYCTNGQGIPEDIEVADSVEIIRQAIELAKRHTVTDVELSESYTGSRLSGV